MNNKLIDGVTIVMPALNEEENIKQSIELVLKVFRDLKLLFELILINDGSKDKTGAICEQYSRNENIYTIHHDKPLGMGSCYKEALKLSKMKYFMLIVSKNECEENSIKNIIIKRGTSDIIIPYTTNQDHRDFLRRNLSYFYTFILTLLTGIKLKYFNGTVLHKTDLLNKIDFDANYHTFQSEALIKLIKLNHTFTEVPTLVNWNKKHKTSAFKIRNIISVINFLIKLLLKRI